MRSAIAEQLDIRRRHQNREAEAVLQLRGIWRQRQPENLCKFGIWTSARNGMIEFTWRDTATSEAGIIGRAPTQNFEHVATAAALLRELAALRSATRKKPATKEASHGVSQRSIDRVGLAQAAGSAAARAITA